MKKQNNKGITTIETIVAILIPIVLFISIYATYRIVMLLIHLDKLIK